MHTIVTTKLEKEKYVDEEARKLFERTVFGDILEKVNKPLDELIQHHRELKDTLSATILRLNQNILHKKGYSYYDMKQTKWFEEKTEFSAFQVDKLINKYGSWFDHTYILKNEDLGEELFISEPYDITSKTISDLENFCNKLGFDYYIGHDNLSLYYPTQTIPIVLKKKEED